MTWYEILIIIGVPTICAFIFEFIVKLVASRTKNKQDDNKLLKAGVQALLRDRLMSEYKTYSKRGWLDVAEKDNYNNMYQQYHGLGKNGVMDGMHSEIMKLPTERPHSKK